MIACDRGTKCRKIHPQDTGMSEADLTIFLKSQDYFAVSRGWSRPNMRHAYSVAKALYIYDNPSANEQADLNKSTSEIPRLNYGSIYMPESDVNFRRDGWIVSDSKDTYEVIEICGATLSL